ncbi:hypothetical protein QBC32DRAFT_328017 [Pseudoneurospora amorphoporcata]|uniref:Uncharacterized protein n=1 Tax=Pseudoneurospora amorphoporcata TaxID=241081 RepID=A0AAN6NLN9_9PEZI|nr:hypothetical protein QBC32DRAFT_328017 [Pseudoneurospora amorphoporcata]
MAAAHTTPETMKSALIKVLAEFVQSANDQTYSNDWQREMHAIIEVFALKYNALLPKYAMLADKKNYPRTSKLLHQFFAKTLRNAVHDLVPLDVEGLKKAVEKLDAEYMYGKKDDRDDYDVVEPQITSEGALVPHSRKRRVDSSDDETEELIFLPPSAPTSYSRKRRRTDTVEASEPAKRIKIPKGKRPVFKWFSKLKVYSSGPLSHRLSTIRGFHTAQNVNGGLDVLEFTFDDPAMIAAKLGSAGDSRYATVAGDGDVDFSTTRSVPQYHRLWNTDTDPDLDETIKLKKRNKGKGEESQPEHSKQAQERAQKKEQKRADNLGIQAE